MILQAYLSLGWSPVFAVVSNGTGGEVLQVTAWVGGTGTAPATGLYVGPTGFTSNIAQAVNIKGDSGPPTIPDGTVLGNNTGSAAAAIALTAIQANIVLQSFSIEVMGMGRLNGSFKTL